MSAQHTPIRCDNCGRFLGEADFAAGHCDYTPETDFGHERIEWTCRRCVNVIVQTALVKDKVAELRTLAKARGEAS